MIFDPLTVAAQAVLSKAIDLALRSGHINQFDWALFDELLIERLRSNAKTKRLISYDYLGQPPNLVFALQVTGELSDYGLTNRTDLTAILDGALEKHFGDRKALSYVFVDRGALEKQLTFSDPDTSEPWVIGHHSRSIVLYGFLRAPHKATTDRANATLDTVLAQSGIPQTATIRRLISGARQEENFGDEPQLTFPAF